jgi:hypothetical protein
MFFQLLPARRYRELGPWLYPGGTGTPYPRVPTWGSVAATLRAIAAMKAGPKPSYDLGSGGWHRLLPCCEAW